MKSDMYMKIVLTVIALCLCWLVVKPVAIQTAQAGRGEIVRVDIVKVAGHYFKGRLPIDGGIFRRALKK